MMLIMLGTLSFPVFAEQTENDVLVGDANKDNDVNILDATTIQRYEASLIGEDNISENNADVDINSFVNIIDATIIQKYKAQIVKNLPYSNTKEEDESIENTYSTEEQSHEDIEYQEDGIKYKKVWNDLGYYEKYKWIVDEKGVLTMKPLYKNKCYCICNICGADVSGNEEGKVGDFDPEYADMYFPQYHYHVQHCASSWHTEVEREIIGYETSYEPEKGHWELVQRM